MPVPFHLQGWMPCNQAVNTSASLGLMATSASLALVASVVGALVQGKRCGTPTTMTRYKIVLQQPYQQQQQEWTELPPKLPMRQFGIIAQLIIGLWGRVCCGMCLDSTQTPPTTVMRYNMQNNYFISAFRKWQNTASWGSVRTSFMDFSKFLT